MRNGGIEVTTDFNGLDHPFLLFLLVFFSTQVTGVAAVGHSSWHPETWQNVLLQNNPEYDNPD